MRLFLMRHGEAEKAPGQDPDDLFSVARDPPLSARGREEAASAAKRVAGADGIVASGARRAQETARIVAATYDLQMWTDARLRELDVRGENYEAMLGNILDLPHRARAEGDPRLHDGERLSEAIARFDAAVRAAFAKCERPVIVGHGLVNRAWLCKPRGLPLDEMLTIPMAHAEVVDVALDEHA